MPGKDPSGAREPRRVYFRRSAPRGARWCGTLPHLPIRPLLPCSSVSLHATDSPDAWLPPARLTRLAFDRRSPRFGQLDFLLGEIGQRMQERMEVVRLAPRRALDIGCGHGQGLAGLRARFPDAQIAGLDISGAMLQQAGQRDPQRRPGWIGRLLGKRPMFDLVQGDLATLPFAPASFDLLWSNLALHWHPEPHRVFPEWHRVSADDGLVMFSLFGPDTLKELRAAFAEVDLDAHTLRFVDMHDIGDMLVHSGWSTPVMDMETLTITYETPEKLLREVQAFGGMRRPGAAGLRGRRWHRAVLAALDRLRNPDGVIPLTFEIVYGHAWKIPARGKQATDDQGRAIIPVDRIGRTPPRR
ncbi:methyltransferase domain-containing protein [Cupriavidus pauculus]|uniref:Malonyl-[acyl-carrier protein] O-methyltransferase n=1 Tax=Cupriavidus pauculus TaxID=82633 RepID=A0A3G8GWM5_9BURK|nr:methyltransferase domain-containing protein [Cupriavidus pauculus]